MAARRAAKGKSPNALQTGQEELGRPVELRRAPLPSGLDCKEDSIKGISVAMEQLPRWTGRDI